MKDLKGHILRSISTIFILSAALLSAVMLWTALAETALTDYGDNFYVTIILFSVGLILVTLLINTWLRTKVPTSRLYIHNVLVAGIVISFAAMLPAMEFYNAANPSVRQINFDQSIWESDRFGAGFPRKINMIDDFQENILKVGMSRENLAEFTDDCVTQTKNVCMIYLGPSKETTGHSAFIDITFENDQIVSFEERSVDGL